MNKEQIQHKFNQILAQGNFPEIFVQLEMDSEVLRLFEQVFNLGLEVAADNAKADVTILTEDGQYEMNSIQLGYDYEVYVIKNSILQHKL